MENSENFRKIENFVSTAYLEHKDKAVCVKWQDSYIINNGWTDLKDDFKANPCIIESWGKVVFIDNKVMALAGNFGEKTEHTVRQANGIMIIPIICIIEITSFWATT